MLNGVRDAIVVEDYPHYHKGRSVLTLQKDRLGSPISCCMGNSKGAGNTGCPDHGLSSRPRTLDG